VSRINRHQNVNHQPTLNSPHCRGCFCVPILVSHRGFTAFSDGPVNPISDMGVSAAG